MPVNPIIRCPDCGGAAVFRAFGYKEIKEIPCPGCNGKGFLAITSKGLK